MIKFFIKRASPFWRFWNPEWSVCSWGSMKEIPSNDVWYRGWHKGIGSKRKALAAAKKLEARWIEEYLMTKKATLPFFVSKARFQKA